MPDITSQLEWMKPKPLSPSASAALDLIRAAAAWAVMWSHLRTMFFADYQHATHPGAPLKIIYFLTGFGHEAVIVFFVLSGFLVSSSIFRNLAVGKWSWVEYAIHRAARLYVVLIPGLLLGLLWDLLGSKWPAATGLYSQELINLGFWIPQHNLTPGIFLGNLLFLQTIVCPTFGSNGPLWSLSNEFWYYVLFPISLFAGISWFRRSLRWAIPLSAIAVFLASFLGLVKLAGFVVWVAGSALVLVYSRFTLRSKGVAILAAIATAVLFFGCSAWLRTGDLGPLNPDLILGTTFTLFLFSVLQMKFGSQSNWSARLSHSWAGFSYSLYVLHFPFLLCLKAFIAPSQRWDPDWVHLFYGVILGTVTLLYSWAVSLVTEDKTNVVRGWLRGAIQKVSG